VTDLTIYGNMTSYMIQNQNFELIANVTVTCDRSNHIWKYSQFTSKITLKHVTTMQVLQPYNSFTNHSLCFPEPPQDSQTFITQFTPIPTVVPLASVPDPSC